MKTNKNQSEFFESLIKKQRKKEFMINQSLPTDLIAKYLTCKICNEILHSPKECGECEQNFCENCINSYIKENKICLNSCIEKKINKTHPLIMSKLEKLIFKCMFCEEPIKYIDHQKHLSECIKRTDICRNENCKFTGTIDEVLKHSLECEYIFVYCPICKTDFQKIVPHNCGNLFIEKYKKLKEKYLVNLKVFDEKMQEIENLIENAIKIARENKNSSNSKSTVSF